MLRVATMSIEGPHVSISLSLSGRTFSHQSGQDGRGGPSKGLHTLKTLLQDWHNTGTKRRAGRKQGLPKYQCMGLLAQQKQGDHSRTNCEQAGAQNVALHHERKVCCQNMETVARWEDSTSVRQSVTGPLNMMVCEKSVPSALIALVAFALLLPPAPANALVGAETSIPSLSRSQYSAPLQPLQRHKEREVRLDKQSDHKQIQPLESSLVNSGLRQLDGQRQLPALEAPIKTCDGTVEKFVKGSLSDASVAAWERMSKLDLVGVSAGLVSGFAMGAVAARGLVSPSNQTGNIATDTTAPAGSLLPPPQQFPNDIHLEIDTLSHNEGAPCPSDNSRQHQDEESTAALNHCSAGSQGHESETDDSDTRNKLDSSSDSDTELGETRSYDEVPVVRLPTCPDWLLPEWNIVPGAINVVLENQTSRPIVLFAEDARPDAEDSIRAAWRVFEGPASAQLLQLRPDSTGIGARRVEGRNMVLRSGPFSAKPKSTWAMLQPTPQHTAWMREATPRDDFFGSGSEGQITVLNLRKLQWPTYDFELFVEGELCAVHKEVEKGKACLFQAPSVISFGVPRPGMNIKKGSVFDSDVDLDDCRVDLDLKSLQDGERVCWLTLGHDAELNFRWQHEVFDAKPPSL